jgi:DDE_Tnp_1-associated/Transposase DDE domain
MRKFKKAFRRLPDPWAGNARHDLQTVLFIALAATLCGADSCSDMADFGQSKEEFLRLFLDLEHGIPSHDTFSRVFRLLDPFERTFRRFMAAFAEANGLKLTGLVAVDGKALRGAYERGARATPLQLVNVFAVEARMVLAQQKAAGRNEIAGALEVLELLCLEGCIVTADALHCHRDFAQAVLNRGGDYALAIKGSRGRLFTAVTQQFARIWQTQQGRADRPIQPRPTRSAARHRHAQCRFRGSLQVPRRRRTRPYHLAQTPARPASPTRRSYATIFCPSICPPSGCCTSPAATGASKTVFIGCSMSTSPRIAIVPERTMRPRTSPSCAGSHSTSSEPTPIAHPSDAKSSAQAGTTPSSWLSSAICDSPAASGVR